MASFKKVKITAANVHDGLGGVFYRGEMPVLPAEIADVFLSRNMAVLAEEMTEKQARDEVQKVEDERRQTEQKSRAEAVMKRHDAKPKEQRDAANESDVSEPPRMLPIEAAGPHDVSSADLDDAILDLEEEAKPDQKPRRRKKGGP